jgi:ParB family transcriptional regulator, chromosome partitioning protein
MTSGKQSLQRIPVDRLVAHEHNRTLDQARVDEMANSIQKVGVLSPLIVTEHLTDYNRWLILDGHHRAAAARQLGFTQLLCTIRHGLDEDADAQLVLMVIGNCQRSDMSPMDRAEWFGLLKRSMTVAQIADRTGLTEGRIYDSLSLLDLDAETRVKVRTGEIGVGQATQAIRQVRAAVRTGTAIGKAPKKPAVTVEAAWFTSTHALADRVRRACDHTDASTGKVRPTVGGLACGQCWERAIRDDELSQNTLGKGLPA